jgi:hypothetical protein
MRGALFILSFLLLAGAPAAAQEADPWAGIWAGEGVDNRGDRFQVRVRIYEDGSARASYDGVFEDQSYSCAGMLLPMRTTRTTRRFREKIDEGECLDEAEVTLSKAPGGALAFAWRGREDDRPVSANTTLRRN